MSVLTKLIVALGLDASEYDKGLEGAEKKADSFGSKLGGFLGGAMKAGLVATAGGVIGALGAIVSGVASNAEFERYETQFGVLLGSTEAARTRLEELAAFGASTPFELPEVVKADKILQGFGLHAQEAADKFGFSGEQIRTIAGDVASGTGASFEEMALLIGKMSAGATGEAISRMAELGIASRSELAALGLEFDKSGALLSPLPQAMEVVLKLMQEKYGGMMLAQSSTMEGMLSNLQDWVAGALRTVSAPIFEVVKEKLQALLGFLNDPTTQETLKSVATAIADGVGRAIDWLSNTGIPMFMTAWQQVTKAFNDTVTFINANVLPTFNLIVEFVTNNASPILAGLAAMLLVVVVPAFVAWAGAALSAAVSTALAMAPVILAVAAVGLAVGLLYAAWENNFLGIRDTVTDIWNSYLSPIFSTVVAWLQTNIPIALQKLSDFWQNTLLPAIKTVYEFVNGTLIPMFSTFVSNTIANVSNGLQRLAGFWTNTLKPAITSVYNFFTGSVVPLFKAIVDVHLAAFGLALRVLAAVWENILLPKIKAVESFISTNVIPILTRLYDQVITNGLNPALAAIGTFINDKVLPALSAIKQSVDDRLTPALDGAKILLGGVRDAFGWISDAIDTTIGWLGRVADKLNSIEIPDWLQGHSPPPMADWFSYIADAAKFANSEFDSFNRRLTNGQVTMPQIPNTINGSAIGHSGQTINMSPITANYAYQDERTIRDQIRMEAMLLGLNPTG